MREPDQLLGAEALARIEARYRRAVKAYANARKALAVRAAQARRRARIII